MDPITIYFNFPAFACGQNGLNNDVGRAISSSFDHRAHFESGRTRGNEN